MLVDDSDDTESKHISETLNSIREYLEKETKSRDTLKIRYGDRRHQRDLEQCGVYALSFLKRRIEGATYEEVERKAMSKSAIIAQRYQFFAKPTEQLYEAVLKTKSLAPTTSFPSLSESKLSLTRDGVAMFRMFQTTDEHKRWTSMFDLSVKTMPEFLPNLPIEHKRVGNAFGALGNPSSFHNPFVRQIRLLIHKRALETVLPACAGKETNVEMVTDCMIIRPPNYKAQAPIDPSQWYSRAHPVGDRTPTHPSLLLCTALFSSCELA